MQKYYDYHTHSTISFDAQVTIEETCALAFAKQASGLTFTEHVELGLEAGDVFPDSGAYQAQIEAARLRYPQLTLGMGLEIDLNPAGREAVAAFVAGNTWDFVIGSVHQVGGLSAYRGDLTAGRSKHEAYALYFAGMLEQVRQSSCFDVLGHIDLIRRDSRYDDRSLDYAEYAELLDPVLKLLIERGQGLEVNTAGWRYGLGEAHPPLDLLRRYRQLGGEVITCGSDCHTAASVFYRIQDGYALIKEAGFRYISLFEQRQLRQLPLL